MLHVMLRCLRLKVLTQKAIAFRVMQIALSCVRKA